MYVMYYVSTVWCWQLVRILVRTSHHCLRVGCHRWVRSWIIDLDSGCPIPHFLLGFLLAPWPTNDASADSAL
jgi:hypothetical protein